MRERVVALLSVAPVKGMGLHHPEQVRLEHFGVPGNRLFYLVDAQGRLVESGTYGRLMAVRAGFDSALERLSLGFPSGEVVEGAAVADGEPLSTSFYGRPVTGRPVPGPWSEAVSRYLGRPVRLIRCERQGDGNDAWPASLVSTASVDELARRAGVGAVDARRFRMLVEIEGCVPHEEDGWIGRRVRVGEAVVRVAEPDSRCVVTTRNPDTGVRDLDTLKAIAAYRGRRDGNRIDFGVYADVERPGVIRVGDAVEPSA